MVPHGASSSGCQGRDGKYCIEYFLDTLYNYSDSNLIILVVVVVSLVLNIEEPRKRHEVYPKSKFKIYLLQETFDKNRLCQQVNETLT